VALFSDAAESPVNLITALVALWALTLAAKPPDASQIWISRFVADWQSLDLHNLTNIFR